MSNSVKRAVNSFREITRWHVSPFTCLYLNPHKYSQIQFAKWVQSYMRYQQYMLLDKVTNQLGLELVPAHLLQHHGARYARTRVRIGNFVFYVLSLEQMGKHLLKRYLTYLEQRKVEPKIDAN